MTKLDVPNSPGASAEVLKQGRDTQVQRVVIEAGGNIPPHVHNVSSSYVVLSGKGRFVGNDGCSVAAGSVVHVPAGEVHGWQDVSESLEFVSVFNGAQVVDVESGDWDLQFES